MKYLAQCALSTGQTRTYTSPFTGTTYTWEGTWGRTRLCAHEREGR